MLTKYIAETMTRPIEQAACLPGFAYNDESFMRLEGERIFRRSWVSIGFAHQVGPPGHVLPTRVAGQPLIMVRGLDGQLRVFHNVCRHRGAQLVTAEGAQPMKVIACPYHRWTYELDGSCRIAPFWYRNERIALRPAPDDDYGLIEVRARVWLDIVFVDLSGTAPPFEEIIAPLAAKWGTTTMAPLNQVTTCECTIPAYW